MGLQNLDNTEVKSDTIPYFGSLSLMILEGFDEDTFFLDQVGLSHR